MKKIILGLLSILTLFMLAGCFEPDYCVRNGCPQEAASGSDYCYSHKCRNYSCDNGETGGMGYCEECLDRAYN